MSLKDSAFEKKNCRSGRNESALDGKNEFPHFMIDSENVDAFSSAFRFREGPGSYVCQETKHLPFMRYLKGR